MTGEKQNQSPLGGKLLIALAATGWGTWSLFFRPAEALGPLSPQLEALFIKAAMLLVAAPLALRSRLPREVGFAPWLMMVAFGVSEALNHILFFRAMQLTMLAVAVLTHSLAPLLVAALAPFLARERVPRRTWLALMVALLGLALLLEPWRAPTEGVLLGAAAGAGSAVFYACNMLLTKRLTRSFAPLEIVGYHAAFTSIVLALLVPEGGFSLQGAQAGLLFAAAFGPGVLGALAFVSGLQRVPAGSAAVLVLLEPLVATLLGVFVWSETLRPVALLGGALLLGAVGATLRGGEGERKEREAEKEERAFGS